MGNIRIILTDLGNVVCSFWDRYELLQRIAIFLEGDPAGIDAIFPEVPDPGQHNEGRYAKLDLGKISLEQLHSALLYHCRIPPTHQTHEVKIVSPFETFYQLYSSHLEPRMDVIGLYQALQGQSMRFAVVSNGDRAARAFADRLAYQGLMTWEKIFVSSEFGLAKPYIFKSVVVPWLNSQQLWPDQCVFIDDLQKYVDAARDLGMHGICFDASKQPVKTLKTELAKLGVTV